MTQTTFHAKSTNSTPLSAQVRQILNEKGFSFLFNWDDYAHYRTEAKNAFNKALAIAELFIQNTDCNSDLYDYDCNC
jgi:hypothetical protein